MCGKFTYVKSRAPDPGFGSFLCINFVTALRTEHSYINWGDQ